MAAIATTAVATPDGAVVTATAAACKRAVFSGGGVRAEGTGGKSKTVSEKSTGACSLHPVWVFVAASSFRFRCTGHLGTDTLS